MYEWRTLRILAGVLLCLPLVHFTYIVARDMNAYLDPSPGVWDTRMEALIQRDLDRAIPEKPIVVAGGQRVRLWEDLPARLHPRSTLLRPLGDATLEDVTHHYDRLVGFYQPDILVIFPSYGDLHLRDDKTPEDYQRALKALLDLDQSFGVSTHRYVISPLQMPLHPEDARRVRAMGEIGRQLQDSADKLTVIDANPMLADVNGRPDPSFFRADGINLNHEGYARISLLLREAMRARGDLP